MVLTGITWDHSRGIIPLEAVAQRYHELHPEIEIRWEKRSLQKFADAPIGDLADQYDFSIIDHPWTGYAIASGKYLQLQKYIDKAYLSELEQNSVGRSFASYCMNGAMIALPIDAAAPIAIYRKDYFGDQQALPETWEDVLQLARRGVVAFSSIPLSTVTDFYMLCVSRTDEFFTEETIVKEEVGVEALESLRELACLCSEEIFYTNPISVYEKMANDGPFRYCPFVFGYSNYSRRGYAKHALKACDVVTYHGNMLKTILGGTGLAISSNCKHVDEAVDFAKFVASPEVQKTIYADNGGQPGHRRAWLDEEVNRITDDFFTGTLQTLDHAFVRPRYNGYLHFQDHAGAYIYEYLRSGGDPKQVLKQLNELYRESKGVQK